MKRITDPTEEETMASRLWKKLGSDSVYAVYSPFCLSLAAGDPDSISLSHFVSQDIILLKSIARACELIKRFVDDDDEKKAIQKVRDSIDLKIQSQNLLLQERGLKIPEENNNPDAVTSKFTEFLLLTASGTVEGEQVPCKIATPFERTKVSAYTIGVVAPLTRLYDRVFHTAKTFLDPLRSSLLCKKWTQYYNSQEFKDATKKIEDALEILSIALTGSELGLVEKLYKKGLSLGVEFFSALRLSPLPLVPLSRAKEVSKAQLIIFCDFDLTCTSVDSGALLAELSIAKVRGQFSEASQIQIETQDMRRRWNLVSNRYAEEYEKCVMSIDNSWPGEDFDYEGLSSALKEVSDFEKWANERVVESGVLKGISERNIKLAGKGLILRDGCKNFFRKIVKNAVSNVGVYIISYCWCSDLIREALSSELSTLNVHANDLTYKESVTTGEIVRKVESPEEKLNYFFEVLRERDGDRARQLTVCIGGDVGDLLCLLEADIGLVTGSSKSLERLGRRFGVEFVPLLNGLVKKSKEISLDGIDTWRPRSGTLYTVSCWAEIEAFILGF